MSEKSNAANSWSVAKEAPSLYFITPIHPPPKTAFRIDRTLLGIKVVKPIIVINFVFSNAADRGDVTTLTIMERQKAFDAWQTRDQGAISASGRVNGRVP
ncbi:MAG: hypothetical protein ABW078_03965 [Sedimenticola sp.]